MPQDPFNQSQWPGQTPSIGTGEGEVPLAPPPTPKIDVRTMASDLKSMEEGGTGLPRAYTPPPPINPVTPPPTPSQTPTPTPPSIPSPLPKKEEESIFFRPPEVPSTITPTTISTASAITKPKSKKGMIIGLGVGFGLVALAALGYFVIYPTFFNKPVEPPPVYETPNIPPPPEPTPEPTPNPTPTPTPEPPITHSSLFKTAPDLTEEISVASLSLNDLKSNLDLTPTDVPTIKEIALKDANNNPLTLNSLLQIVLPNVFNEEAFTLFDRDVTFFVYTNEKGAWPGFIAATEIQSLPVLQEFQTKIGSLIEGSSAISTLFLVDPGSASSWKSGKTGGTTNRYLSYSMTGAALNYGWSGSDLIVTTSYDAFKETLKRLE
ncbi:hypothetical protein HY967_00295 [Candidatus Jorgensenbacteria bacterium]|nr:hypothetical protein [Candidatus Jorgensenbacteria bacterium]